MAYLHRLNILHRDLKPGNILLDEFLYPKIADFGLSKVLYGEDEIENSRKHPITSGFKGIYAYCAPEIISQHKYSKSGDVYAYGMIVYEIITNEIIFKDFNRFKLGLEIVNGYRPEFKFPIPYCFRKLIERCWSGDCETRPSFNEIVELLETNSRFITPNVDKDEYHDYISYIKESFPSNPILNQSGKIDVNSSTLSSTPSSAKPAKKHSINLKIIESEKNELNKNDECFLDLTKFERKEIINKNDSSKIYKFKEIETGQIFAGQMSMIKIGQISKTEIDELKKELNDISKLKHPCLLKFYGYSPIDFKKQPKPVIITEYFSNGSLSNILELERNQQPIEQWNFTKKLINLYGIASCMSYLHSNGIIHKTLNPNNIFLDDILTPKIGDFGLSSKFEPFESITVQSISGIKATPIYLSPEILLNNEYSRMSDVYAFGMIAYEMICNEIPFKEIENHNQIFHEVVNNQKRPYITDNIPLSYVKLIEECWSQDMNERPTFDDIVYRLKADKGFITEYIDSDDYHKYIKFIEEQLELASHERIDECENNTGPTLIKKVEVNTKINETEVNTTYEKNHILLNDKIETENKLNEGEEINIEHLENLAIKYISSNDSENIYRILNILIQNRSTRIAVNYAISLYKAKQYQVSFNYFRILSKHNHPIAKYFIGIMKFKGQGCEENRSESYKILKYLSDYGIDRATVFLEEYFSK